MRAPRCTAELQCSARPVKGACLQVGLFHTLISKHTPYLAQPRGLPSAKTSPACTLAENV
eukprot:779378-Pelagomonas_calceolata.AAC.6